MRIIEDFHILKMHKALYNPPVGLQKGVAEAEGRAEFRNGWLALSEGKGAVGQGMLNPGWGRASCKGAALVAGLTGTWNWSCDILIGW